MKRSKPMRRTGFKAKGWQPKPAKQIDYEPRPRAPSGGALVPLDKLVKPRLKFRYVRDVRLRDMCRSMECQHCGAAGPEAGVTWAHSNQAIHGKGRSIKASDVFVAALCKICHHQVDQGFLWTQEEKVAVWNLAHWRTVERAVQSGLWPLGVSIPVPALGEDEPRPEQGRGGADEAYLATLRQNGGWMSAGDVAAIHGIGWHVVAFALRRMVEQGEVEEDVVDTRGRYRSVEHSRVYRARPRVGEARQLQTELPSWLAPQLIVEIGAPRRVLGRAGMRRWEMSEEDELPSDDQSSGGPGGPGGPENGAASTTDGSGLTDDEESTGG